MPESDATIIAWTDLNDAERKRLERAFEGDYRPCDDGPDAAGRMADRRNYPQTYLSRNSELYGLWLAITDIVYATTTDAPEGACGFV